MELKVCEGQCENCADVKHWAHPNSRVPIRVRDSILGGYSGSLHIPVHNTKSSMRSPSFWVGRGREVGVIWVNSDLKFLSLP